MHVQLRDGALVERARAAAQLRSGLVDYLASASRDFAEAVGRTPQRPRCASCSTTMAPARSRRTAKIKNVYVVRAA